MKKRVIITLLVAITAGTIIACGNAAHNEEVLPTTAAVGSEESFEEEPTTEAENETKPTEEKTNTEKSKTEESQTDVPGSIYADADKTGDKTEVLNTPQTMLSSTEVSVEEVAYINIVEAKDEVSEYTFDTMDSVVMYAKSSVNVRDLPDTQGNKVSRLAANQEVVVTGQCRETGWYRILLDDIEYYVSDSYLVDAPVVVNASNNTQAPSNMGVGAVNTAVGGVGSIVTSSESSGVSQDFLNLLNQKRAEAGLGTLEWDGGLADIAQRRAKEIAANFSHDGQSSQEENLYKGDSASCSDWYSAWYNSDIHRAAMMYEYNTKGACAFYEINGYYYVVFVASHRPPTQDEWNQKIEQGLEDGSMVQFTNEEAGVTVIASEGTEIETDQNTIDHLNAALREAGLIP